MKTYNHLFDQVTDFGNLLEAHRLASRGRRFQDANSRFNTAREHELVGLKEELETGTWRPGPYSTHTIHHPKKRLISAAPFRDRVVQHALCKVTMPLFERRMVSDLYSNRPGKGTHAAIDRAQSHCRNYRFVLKADIRRFFPSLDHLILKSQLRRTIRCRRTLGMFDLIIDGSNPQEPVCNVYPGDDLVDAASRRVGLPIGNLTSQWFGGIYMDRFDHWALEELRCGGYVRYVDDFLLFGDSKGELADWRESIIERLAADRLRVNERKTRVFRTTDGITFLGQRIWPTHRRLARSNAIAARRRLLWCARLFKKGEMSRESLIQRWQSWKGHAMQAGAGSYIDQLKNQLRDALRDIPQMAG